MVGMPCFFLLKDPITVRYYGLFLTPKTVPPSTEPRKGRRLFSLFFLSCSYHIPTCGHQMLTCGHHILTCGNKIEKIEENSLFLGSVPLPIKMQNIDVKAFFPKVLVVHVLGLINAYNQLCCVMHNYFGTPSSTSSVMKIGFIQW